MFLKKLKDEKNKHKYVRLFLKRFLRYFIILVFIIALAIPLVLTSYKLIKEKTIDSSYEKLCEGFHALEVQILNLKETSDILLNDLDFSQLLLLKGPPQTEDYMHIEAVQSKLRNLFIDQEYMSNIYILFKNNPVFISNYVCTDNYKNIYPRFLNYEGLSSEEWYNMLFSEKYIIKFLPQRSIYSEYYGSNYFNAITCMVNNSNYRSINLTSVIACTIDTKYLLYGMLDKGIIDNGFAYITDANGDIIFRHNYNSEDQIENVSNLDEISFLSEKYLMLTNRSVKLGLSVVAGIPVKIFRKNIASMISLVLLYSIVGICVIFVISLWFSMKETILMRKLIDVASSTSNITFNKKNDEYSYINDVIRKIGSVNIEQSNRINTLNNSIKSLMLEKLFVIGIYDEKEKNEIINYFNNEFELFCVVKMQILGDASKSQTRNIVFEVDNTIKKVICKPYLLFEFHQNEIIFVVFFDDVKRSETNIDNMQTLRIDLCEKCNEVISIINNNTQSHYYINIGISMIVSGVKEARNAYIQASYALNSNHDAEYNFKEGRVYLYNTPKSIYNRKIFDIGELLKIYNSILSGDENLVTQVFKNIFKHITNSYLTEQEQLQIFFTLRQTVYTAYVEILDGFREDKKGKVMDFPIYIPDRDFEKQFKSLMEFSIGLCNLITVNKRSNNEKLKSEIINYIQMNYYNMNLTAATIADEMMLSEKYVFSFIKENKGKSLGQYIEDIRISKAEEYLLNSDFTNKEIAQICGFGSENTFYRAFSRKHGLSPKTWKEIHKK